MDGKQGPDAFQPAGVTVAEVARALAAVRPARDSAGLIARSVSWKTEIRPGCPSGTAVRRL